tara:strand:+ start:184 stop:483 length:300 start_codon:yes stop_codon:yes gene_type:complete
MSDELKSHFEKDINVLHERSQETKTHLSTHEAVCEERYENILSTFTSYEEKLDSVHKEILELKTLATQGKTSLRTLFFVGTTVAAIIAALAAFSNIKWG